METLRNIYPKIYDFENLHQAYLEARKNKRFREDVLRFTANLEENLIQLQNELIYKTYSVGRYREFYVREPKKRLIMALQFRDRVVQWAIYRQIYPYFDARMIDDSYACRIGRGALQAAERLQYWVRQVSRRPARYYYLKLDISKYFYRVDHAVLIEILGRHIQDADLMWLLETIINCEHTAFGLPAFAEASDVPTEDRLADKGIPIGNLTSQMFANIYLGELDWYAKRELRLHYYVRYMDDIIILHEDKDFLRGVKDDIEAFLAEHLRLNLNRKTAIRPVSHSIEFVGYRIWPTHKRLKKKTAKKMRRSLKGVRAQYQRGEITAERLRQIEASYDGMLQHVNGDGLRQALGLLPKKDTAPERGLLTAHPQDTWTPPAERTCYNCGNFFTSYFCGYNSCNCKIYGSLDVDQHERHPDTAGAECRHFWNRNDTGTKEGAEKEGEPTCENLCGEKPQQNKQQ